MADATIRIDADTRAAEAALGRVQKLLGSFAAIAGVAAVAKGLADVADQATNLKNKLNLVSSSQDYTNYSFEKLAAIANNARAPLDAVGSLYFSMARSAGTLGINNEQARTATELLAKGMTASGMSAQQASGPLLQLSQAFQSGTFQGDELRSVLEGFPTVSQALAKSLGVPLTALKYLGSQGKISGSDLVTAILGAGKQIEADFKRSVVTIGQALTVLSNNWTVFIDKLNTTSGAGNVVTKAIGYISAAIVFLGDNIDTILIILEILATVFLAGKVVSAIKYLAPYVIQFGNTIKSIGYVITDFGTTLIGIFGNVVRFWKSAFTTMEKAVEAGITGWHYYFRAFFVYLGTIVKSIGSLLLNLAGPIVLVGGYFSDMFDSVIAKAKSLLSYLPLIGKYFTPAVSTDTKAAEDAAAAEKKRQEELARITEDKAKKAKEISAKQFQYNEELRKSIQSQVLSNFYDNLKGKMLDEEIAYQRAIAEEVKKAHDQGVGITVAQQIRVGNLAKEKVVIEQIQAGMAKYNELTTAGLNKQYFDDLRNLEQAHRAGRFNDEKTYQESISRLTLKYQTDLFSAELSAYQELKNGKFTLDNKELILMTEKYDLEAQLVSKLAQMRFQQVNQELMTVTTKFNTELAQIKTLSDLEFTRDNAKLIRANEEFNIRQSNTQRLMEMEFNIANQKMIMETQLYDMQVAQQEKLIAMKQSQFQQELQQRGFTLEQSKSIATERTNFEKKSEMEKTNFAIEQAGTVFNELGKRNKTAFEAAKAFNIANAIMNTYMGATKALATYPPPFNFIAAAAVVAMGLAQVASIRGQTYSGRAMGGPIVGGQQYMVGERGPELITAPSGGARVTPNSQMGGQTNIVFQIQTNDARGFDQLLAERKGLIINMVRQAQMDKGRMATV